MMYFRPILFIFLLYQVSAKCPDIISRSGWNASPPGDVTFLRENPPSYIVVHHSATKSCNSKQDCIPLVKSIQNSHINDKKWSDIGYNFLIGGDGNIYEGRGWGIRGAHSVPYNKRSLGICLLGNFEIDNPHSNQLKALEDLLYCARTTNKITENYRLIGHGQRSSTLCPGKNLYNVIKTWPHFDPHPQ
ncbi:peptidoglycan-recognition protein SC2-like [Diorhabda sublineata]|uniref:peptidoglycan-recognition protein SC2-like n=1 Tax=Diorhabda sublineata TaxID=1163346 RepID=UPI0024E16DB4|nr:peptidoglycan-recognition protein SC2-like [Diorhabda sublineata]